MQTEQEYILLRYPDDKVVILGFLTKARGSLLPYGASWLPEAPGWWYRPATEANINEELSRATQTLHRSHGIGAPLSWKIVAKEDLPQIDPGVPRYRDAWRYDGTSFSHHAETLQELHRDILRVERGPLLAELDGAWMAATRKGDAVAVAEINAEKQVLLDAPAAPEIAAATMPDEVRSITIDYLLDKAVVAGAITAPRTRG